MARGVGYIALLSYDQYPSANFSWYRIAVVAVVEEVAEEGKEQEEESVNLVQNVGVMLY